MKGKFLKVVSGIVLAVVVAVVGVFAYSSVKNNFFPSADQLQPVTTITRSVSDDGQYYFSWNEVEGADRYGVIISKYDDGEWQQGSPYVVNENECGYSVDAEKIAIKVQAQDSTGEKANSEWSKEYVHEINQQQISYDSANLFVSSMLPYKLLKVVNISIDGNAVRTNAIFQRNNKVEMYELYTYYENGITSLEDCMNTKPTFNDIENHYEVVDYNSADYLLQSNSFVGQMEEYRQQGYTFEVISQHVAKVDERNKAFFVYATYKLTKGDEVKYINNKMTVAVNEESPNEIENYTKKVANTEDRLLREEFCHELEGDEITLAQEMEKLYQQKETTQNQTTQKTSTNSGNYNQGEEFCLWKKNVFCFLMATWYLCAN